VFTRSITYTGDPARIDEGIAFARDTVAPALAGLKGTRGMSVLVDRDSGRCMVNSVWTDEAAMHASNAALAPIREKGGEILGSPADVSEWEIAIMHEVAPVDVGCGIRVTRLELDPSDLDGMLDTVRTTTIPAAELLPGWCRMTVVVDRTAGRAMALSSFRNVPAMQDSRERVDQIRTASVEKAHARVQSVEEYEVAFYSLGLEPTG
jgi:quinol monooxygenase YgiN